MLLHILIPAENLHVHLPYVAKSYFETYKSYDHMQIICPRSQNFNEILTFENMETMRFCHTLTYKNRRNSINQSIYCQSVLRNQLILQTINILSPGPDRVKPHFQLLVHVKL